MRDAAVQGPAVVAVGFFDGVHLGHRAILADADVALTFRTHPLRVLAPGRAPRLIMSLDDRLAAIRACGVRDVVALDFTPALAALPPAAFAERHLAPLGAAGALPHVRCGANWRFGKGGAGDADALRALGYAVTTVPYATFAGAPVSSSRIRAALTAGDVASANAMLGRPFRTHGERQAGKGLGAKIGFPTVNLLLPGLEIDLPHGVYEVSVAGARGIANYGVAPTMGARQWPRPVLEVHFPGRDAASVPTAPIAVDFLRFVRPERTFASVAELKRQIARDCELSTFFVNGVRPHCRNQIAAAGVRNMV